MSPHCRTYDAGSCLHQEHLAGVLSAETQIHIVKSAYRGLDLKTAPTGAVDCLRFQKGTIGREHLRPPLTDADHPVRAMH